jgi:hypothetical protein
MSKELLLQRQQRQVNPLKNENDNEDKEEKIIKKVVYEIECSLYYNILALSSDYDRLCYLCQECSLSLLIN